MNKALFLLALGLACSTPKQTDSGSSSLVTDVKSIRVEPDTVSLSTAVGAPASAQFTAYAKGPEGVEFETDMVSWEISNLSAGSIDENGLFTATELNGGITLVSAIHVGIEGTAEVTIVYEQDIVDDSLEAGVADAFEAASPFASDELDFNYPPDGVTVPRNLNGLAFDWDLPPSANVSRLRLQSGITDVSVYTPDSTWYATSELWALISAANTEGTVDIHLESGSWDGTSLSEVGRGSAITLTVNRLDARGSVLYWVARSEDGGDDGGGPTGDIMRIPFGSLSANAFWTAEDSGGNCTGCHTLSEASEKMVVTNDGVNGTFSIIDVSDPDRPEVEVWPEDHRRATFHAASPDGSRLLTVHDGLASIYDLLSGQKIGDVPTEGYRVSHPDWSPDGSDILLVRVTSTQMNDMNFEGGEIIQIPYNEGGFGPASVLVEREDDRNNYYPAYSPDGEWIVFNRAVRTEIIDPGGGVHTSSTCYANPSAELWLIRRDGTSLVRLDAANGTGDLQNSFPRWGPLPDDDVLWLAYSSVRPYAPDPNQKHDPQIWVSAIEPGLVDQGEDPSSVPFWLPAQDSQSDNHLAIWWSQ